MMLASPVARRIAPLIASVAVALILAACGQSQQGGFHGFPPAQVTTLVVQPKSLPVSYEYVAQTVGSKEVEVRARVGGILEKRLYTEGGWVKAGQPMYLIDPKPLEAQSAQAEAEVARVHAQVTQAERELARLKPLAERRAVGQKEADDAQSNLDTARAAEKAAAARLAEVKLNLGYTRVNAPLTGLSSRSLKSEGTLVTANETLLTLIWQVDPIWVAFTISENEQLALNKAVAAGKLVLPKDNAYDVTIKRADGSIFPRKGKINFADTRVNPSTGTYEMRAEIANADGALTPGQFARVQLKGAVRTNALAVPQVAVLDGAQGKFVYVTGKDKDGKDIAVVRPVVLGDWIEMDGQNLWIVESGLKAGDTVIVDGIARLQPNGAIMLGGPGPGAPGGAPGAAAGPPEAKDATAGKDGAKSAPPSKS
ncbi:MAG TPA: efflux RND transporter periplasmic adaptor subunit [Casimicrobiaceae bacterium]|nr:efflux RND transporter periplasmic adaptor subunit [Casimicrobiaceae bacterium]